MDIHIGGVRPIKQANNAQCWYASASMIYAFRGKPAPPMVQGDAADEGLWSFEAMNVLVKNFGFRPIDRKFLHLDDFDAEHLGALMLSVESPLLCMGAYQPGVKDAGHVVVVFRVTDTRVYYMDPFWPRETDTDFADFNKKLFKEMDPSCIMWLPK